MTLDEIRVRIDAIDTQMKPLFVNRMECAAQVAAAKAKTGGDVFVLERELAIIEKRASDIDADIYNEYVAFLRHMMSVSRRYQYGILTDMQERVLKDALEESGLDGAKPHDQVEISFTCKKEASDLNLFMNMIRLNKVEIDGMNLTSKDAVQTIDMTLDGNIHDGNMKRLLCQIGKEADGFKIRDLK